ncbi:MAG: hypothetical protein RIC56_14145 [Pseudomonadales bacterium]
MRESTRTISLWKVAAVVPLLGAAEVSAGGHSIEVGEFSEFDPIVEINATDGDVGFHMLLDGDPWRIARVYDPKGRRLISGYAAGPLRRQGITEFFLESAEPLCWDDPEEEDERIVTVSEFIKRFRAGEYKAFGWTIENVFLYSTGELTHALPAAPEVRIEVDSEDEDGEVEVTVHFGPGDDLGRCAFDDADIPDPASVPVVRWEVVVEPDDEAVEEAGLVFSKFTVQLLGRERSVEVPEEFLAPYLAAGITEFKGEVGAKEASGNQTFTEIEFEIGEDEED